MNVLLNAPDAAFDAELLRRRAAERAHQELMNQRAQQLREHQAQQCPCQTWKAYDGYGPDNDGFTRRCAGCRYAVAKCECRFFG